MKVRAAVLYEENKPLEIKEVELLPPGEHEVLVKLSASGVCHSDLSSATGKSPTKLPAILGHEGAGVVEQVGPGVTNVKPGDHVVLSWNPDCGECDECNRGLPHLCSNAWKGMFAGGLLDGTSRFRLDGEAIFHYSMVSSFAEKVVVPDRSCVVINQDVPLEIASLVGCAVTTGVGAVWNTAQVRPGDRIAVFGCGGVGLSAVLGAIAVGASQIIVVDTRADKLETALRMGATDAVQSTGTPEETAAEILRLSNGGVDYAFDAVGASSVTLSAFLSTRKRGAAVVIGIPAQDAVIPIPALSIPRMERRILGSLYGSASPRRDFPLILDLFMRGRLPLDKLISHRLRLDEAQHAMDLVKDGAAVRAVLQF